MGLRSISEIWQSRNEAPSHCPQCNVSERTENKGEEGFSFNDTCNNTGAGETGGSIKSRRPILGSWYLCQAANNCLRLQF